MNDQIAVPCSVIRGGTSKGLYFHARDLPPDTAQRDAVLLAALGSPDAREIDGMGGGQPTDVQGGNSKGPRIEAGADVDYLFLSDLARPCRGLGQPELRKPPGGGGAVRPRRGSRGPATATLRGSGSGWRTQNNHRDRERGRLPTAACATSGAARIDGVPGTSAPIPIEFLDVAGDEVSAVCCPAGTPSTSSKGCA